MTHTFIDNDDSRPSQHQSVVDNLSLAFAEVTASSMGGAPFLIAYGITFGLIGVLSLVLERETTALLAMFQGVVALPFAFWLERRLGRGRLSAENPLKKLSALMAMSQALALPLLIAAYSVAPGIIPLALAGLGGVHFFSMNLGNRHNFQEADWVVSLTGRAEDL